MPDSRPARLVDVARHAGVTVSTASRALARPEMVRAETRARVVAAAEELGYVPDRAARTLITGRAGVIALVVPDLTNPYFAAIARAAQTAAEARGYDMAIVDTLGDPQREREIVDVVSRWLDGIVVCAASRTHRPNRHRTPIVYVNRRARGSHTVMLDQELIVDEQIRHLVELGHERIGWVNGPKAYWASSTRRRRAERWGTRHDVRLFPTVTPDMAGGYELAEMLDPDVTAVATFNDRQAFGLIKRAGELGIRVPEDLSIVGSDDVVGAEFANPGLTTVHSPKEDLGRTAVSLLLDHLGDDGPVIQETLRGHLVVRESTAPPRAPRRGGAP